jgi:hypothetical protein
MRIAKRRPRITMAIVTLCLSAWLDVPTVSAQAYTLSKIYLDENALNTPLDGTRRTIFHQTIECPATATSCAVRIEASAFVDSVGANVWARVDVDNSTSSILPRAFVKLTSGEGPSLAVFPHFPDYTGVRTFSVYKWSVTPGSHEVHVQLFTTEGGTAWFLNGLLTTQVLTQ